MAVSTPGWRRGRVVSGLVPCSELDDVAGGHLLEVAVGVAERSGTPMILAHPARLSEVGVPKEELGRLSEVAVTDMAAAATARHASAGEIEQLYRAVF